MSDPEPEEGVKAPITLSLAQRTAATATGVILLGAGLWAAVVAGRDGIATVALIVCGAIVLLLGVIGRMPTKLTGKDYGVEWAQEAVAAKTKAAVGEVISGLPPELQRQLSETGAAINISGPVAANSARSIDVRAIAGQEYSFYERVARLLVDLHAELGQELSIGDGFGMDAILNFQGARIGVETKSQILSDETQLLVMQARIGGRERWLDAMLLVTPGSVAAYVPCANFSSHWSEGPSVEALKKAVLAISPQVGACDGSFSGP